MLTTEIQKISSDIFDRIVSIRREIHKYPETGFKEYKTSSFISSQLDALKLNVRRNVAQTGVVALLEGAHPGKTVAIRADIDALPIKELNTCDYKSQNEGFMHACGHDAHIAMVLGAAEILSKYKDRIKGNVKFIFQPGEEGFYGGKSMVEEGVLETPPVDAIIAAHVQPSLPSGSISIRAGAAFAIPSDFEITIIGKSGHAAEPHNTIDPITIGANLVNLFQTIITREKRAVNNAVLSVSFFNSGNYFNIIPDTAVLGGTVRTFDQNLDKYIASRIEEITASVTKAMGAAYKFHYKVGYPPVINDEKIVKQIIESSGKVINTGNIITDIEPFMLGEDFSYYVQKVPGAIFNLGCGNPEAGISSNLHSSTFNIDESCLKKGMEIMSQFAVDFLGIAK